MKKIKNKLILLVLLSSLGMMTSSFSCGRDGCFGFTHNAELKNHKAGQSILMIELTPNKKRYANKGNLIPNTTFKKLKVNDTVLYNNLLYRVVYKKPVKDGYLLFLKLQK